MLPALVATLVTFSLPTMPSVPTMVMAAVPVMKEMPSLRRNGRVIPLECQRPCADNPLAEELQPV